MVDDDPIDHDAESARFLAAYEAGDKRALWEAIIYCAMNRIPAWGWLRNGLYAIDMRWKPGRSIVGITYLASPGAGGSGGALRAGHSDSKFIGRLSTSGPGRSSPPITICTIASPRNSNLGAAKWASYTPACDKAGVARLQKVDGAPELLTPNSTRLFLVLGPVPPLGLADLGGCRETAGFD